VGRSPALTFRQRPKEVNRDGRCPGVGMNPVWISQETTGKVETGKGPSEGMGSESGQEYTEGPGGAWGLGSFPMGVPEGCTDCVRAVRRTRANRTPVRQMTD
jgi:hypothetical protein